MTTSTTTRLLPVEDPVDFLAGSWTFERRTEERSPGRATQVGHAEGVARFEPSDHGTLAWIERGTLHLAGNSFDASRELGIVREGDGWLVRFSDGRPFHSLDLGAGRSRVEHLCRADLYTGELSARATESGSEFRTEWRVDGPAKEQWIETTYRRLKSDRG